jgi:hypothetical protein
MLQSLKPALHAAHAARCWPCTLRGRIGIGGTRLVAAAAVRDVGRGVGFAAIGDIAIAVGIVGVAAGDATVAGGAAGRAIGDPRADLAAGTAVRRADGSIDLAAIHGARFAGPVAPGTHRRGAATCRARNVRGGTAGRALVAAVAAVATVTGTVDLAAIGRVAVAVQEQSLAAQLTLALDTQAPVALVPPGQTLPHAPQLLASRYVSVSQLSEVVLLQSL